MTEEQKRLVEDNLGLVQYVAKKYVNGRQSLTMDDLVQYGVLGLIRAIETYDKSKNVAFSTYAVPCIQNAITRSIDTYDLMIRVPEYMQKKIRQAEAIQDEEMIHRLAPLAAAVKAPYGIELCDNPPDFTQRIKYFTTEDTAPSPEELYEQKEELAWVRDLLISSNLTEKERLVLEYSFGFRGKIPPLREIGALFGVSRERARQIKEGALRKLRRQIKREERMSLYG